MKNKILNTEEINYLFDIVVSEIGNKEKAKKLYMFCKVEDLCEDLEQYHIYDLRELKKLKRVFEFYNFCKIKGYFDHFKNPYKCTMEETIINLNKINYIYEVINSNISEYSKAKEIFIMFRSLREFKKTYLPYVKYGINDPNLDFARDSLNHFNLICQKIEEYEKTDIIKDVKYLIRNEDYMQNYQYAKFVLEYYIDSKNSYIKEVFFEEIGITNEIFEYCIDTIKELDIDLYNKYLQKKDINNKLLINYNSSTISDLTSGIRTGVLKDGTEFTLLEFIKRVPFKENRNFYDSLKNFTKENNPDDYEELLSYVNSNQLYVHSLFYDLDLKTMYRIKTIVNGIEITNEDNDLILEYLRANNVPIILKTYLTAREQYLNGNLTTLDVNNAKKQNNSKDKVKTLIPSNK